MSHFNTTKSTNMNCKRILIFSFFLILLFSDSYSQVPPVPLCSCPVESAPSSCCLTPDNEEISISECQCKCSYNGTVISDEACITPSSSGCLCPALYEPVCCKNKVTGEAFTASNDACCQCEGEVLSDGECSEEDMEIGVSPTMPELGTEMETPEVDSEASKPVACGFVLKPVCCYNEGTGWQGMVVNECVCVRDGGKVVGEGSCEKQVGVGLRDDRFFKDRKDRTVDY